MWRGYAVLFTYGLLVRENLVGFGFAFENWSKGRANSGQTQNTVPFLTRSGVSQGQNGIYGGDPARGAGARAVYASFALEQTRHSACTEQPTMDMEVGSVHESAKRRSVRRKLAVAG